MNISTKIKVIYNPISGKRKKEHILSYMKDYLKNYDISFHKTQYINHAKELAIQFITDNSVSVIAVIGGDGTVNEVGQAMINSEKFLWIIPSGSGNGLARSLKIKRDYKKNIRSFDPNRFLKIDLGVLDENIFLGTAGIGLDGEVAHQFASTSRGLKNYIKITKNAFFQSPNTFYDLLLDKKIRINKSGVLLTLSNSGQYGNDFYISPQSIPTDGYIEVVILKKSKSLLRNLLLLFLILIRKSHWSKLVSIYKCQEAEINCSVNKAHIDGEPIFLNHKKSTFHIMKGALKILIN